MITKHQKKNFIRKYYSQLVVLSVMLLIDSTLLITTPSSAFSVRTNEETTDSPIKQDTILQESELDYDLLEEEYEMVDDDTEASELEDEKEDTEPELNEENDDADDDSKQETEPESNTEDGEEEEENIELIPVIGVTAKAELEKVYERASSFSELQTIVNTARTEVNTVITVTAGFNFSSALNITAGRHITIQSDSDVNPHELKHTGDTRHFILNNDSSLTLKSIVLDGLDRNTVSGGIQVNNGGHLIMDGGIITNCRATTGGGVNVLGMLTMEEGSISNNTAEASSGGVRLQGTLQMNGGEINGNIAGQHGGGVSVMGSGRFTMTGGSIHNNEATISGQNSGHGGGIYLFSGGQFTMNGGLISDNTAYVGGGMSAVGNSQFIMGKDAVISENTAHISGGGVVISSKFTMDGGRIDNNEAITENGGGVSIWQGATFEMIDGTITDNEANQYGGGISIQLGATFIMQDGDIHDNSSKEDGGGIHIYGNGTFDMSGGKIYDNTAVGNGGGVNAQGVYNMTGGEIYRNTANNGGGIYTGGGMDTANLQMSNGIIHNNTAHNHGGGVFSSGTVLLNGVAIYDNNANNGAGIYSETVNITMDRGTILNNTARNDGGGLWASGTFTMNGGDISGNTAINDGGGVLVQNGTFDMMGGEISSNEATRYGGGVWIAGSTFNIQPLSNIHTDMDEALIDQNKARMGAGVYIESGSLTMTRGIISNNVASHAGGGVFSSPTTSPLPFPLAMMVDELDEDEPGLEMNLDGVIFDDKPELSMNLDGVTIHNNTATLGGGVFSHETSVTMTGGSIRNNHAIHHPLWLLVPPTGAGLWASGDFIMKGGAIHHNESAGYGGGVFIYNRGLFRTEESLNIYENKAAVGGGVAISPGGRFEMDGGDIYNNKAIDRRLFIGDGDGGGVAISPGGTFNMSRGDIHTNEAAKNGGGVVIASGAEFEMDGGNIHNNKAVNSGGGVMVSGAFSMVNGNISSNTASLNGGGVALGRSGGTFDMRRGDISSNTAEQDGGGIYAPTINLESLNLNADVTFSDNSAIQSYPPPLGFEAALPNIQTRSSTVYNHPLNNYDIGYSAINPPVRMLSILRNPIFGGDVLVQGETNLNDLQFMGAGLLVNLEAQPKPGYRFVEWTSSDGGSFRNHTDMNTAFTTPNNDTIITANFERVILDPLNPDKVVTPESDIDIPEADGFISIDFVSSFDFGKHTISFKPMYYDAQPQRLLDENGNPNEVRPNYIQITDNRAVNNGWTLSVTQLDQFKEYGEDEGHVLEGARLTLQHAELVSASLPSPPQPSHFEKSITLIPDETHTLITAKPDEGQGVWIYRFGNEDNFSNGVQLEVPAIANPKATNYQTTLHWELSWGPANSE